MDPGGPQESEPWGQGQGAVGGRFVCVTRGRVSVFPAGVF